MQLANICGSQCQYYFYPLWYDSLIVHLLALDIQWWGWGGGTQQFFGNFDPPKAFSDHQIVQVCP